MQITKPDIKDLQIAHLKGCKQLLEGSIGMMELHINLLQGQVREKDGELSVLRAYLGG